MSFLGGGANALVMGALFALLGLSFALVYNTMGIFHVAHGAAYTAAPYLWLAFRSAGLPESASVGFALLATALFGAAMERAVFWRLFQRTASRSTMLLSSLGLYIACVSVIEICFGNAPRSLGTGSSAVLPLSGLVLTRYQLVQALTALALTAVASLVITRTAFGKILRAVRDDANLITILGMRLDVFRGITFSVASALAGVVALLVAFDGDVSPHIGLTPVLIGAVAVTIGGAGSFSGAALGGFILGFCRSVTISAIASEWAEMSVFVLLLGFLMVRPQGLLVMQRRVEEGSR